MRSSKQQLERMNGETLNEAVATTAVDSSCRRRHNCAIDLTVKLCKENHSAHTASMCEFILVFFPVLGLEWVHLTESSQWACASLLSCQYL